ncbi:uncharacterized protein N7482_000032 [Penicillium canariense]|uniref:Uncharacterized protein n=1 Tax=Penicillium canariense TaxID=189055 RepID=A0A9W9LS98_9EURO|nr:uncharacterized protein N7482_000032 [Penicillium canariense]KAJ5174155.1 hypothetical protein N7482_000032 [Penicillium canariense]
MTGSKVAIVTGGAAGIGLQMSKRLLSKGYRVVLADIDSARGTESQKQLGDQTHFVHCNLADWDSQAAMFKKAYQWAGRLDVFIANAGIDEKEPFYDTPSVDDEPRKPNMAIMDVDLSAVIYGLRLFRYYVRKSGTGEVAKMIATSSIAGLYSFHVAPMYAAAKHGVIGILRAAAFRLRKKESITLNVICPGPVLTELGNQIREFVPDESFTPMSVILAAFDKFLDEDITGKVAECSNKEVHIREPVDYPNENTKWLIESMKGL